MKKKLEKSNMQIIWIMIGIFIISVGCGKKEEIVLPTKEVVENVSAETDSFAEETDVDDCECAEVDIPALVKVNGILYYDSAEISTEARCGMMDGIIDSVCEGDVPSQNNQSNFGKDYGYQYGIDTIEVLIDDEWHIFKKFDYHENGWDKILIPDVKTNSDVHEDRVTYHPQENVPLETLEGQEVPGTDTNSETVYIYDDDGI